ncbi:MAG: hypothetical protein WCB92_06765 [Mycobacterium sp.]
MNGSSIGLFMGGSGLPIPTTGYITGVLNYVNQNFNVATANVTALFTPEGFYPITGFKSLPLPVPLAPRLQTTSDTSQCAMTTKPWRRHAPRGSPVTINKRCEYIINLHARHRLVSPDLLQLFGRPAAQAEHRFDSRHRLHKTAG